MQQTKVSLTEPLAEFVGQYKHYGFRDKSDMVRAALTHLRSELELQRLKESAALYAEQYEEDAGLRELTETALVGWPQ